MTADYPPPLDQLLTLGEPAPGGWPDYLARGIGPQHAPDLIRMATDPGLNDADGESPLVWAPLHAWRALGQLRATEAVGPLLRLLVQREDDEWAREEMPEVFGLIGPPALPALASFLADRSHGIYPRWCVADAIKDMAQEHPEVWDDCVGVLVRRLEQAEEEDPEVNAALVS